MKNLAIIGALFIIGCSSSTSIDTGSGEGGDPGVSGGSGGAVVAGSAGVENVSGGTDSGGTGGSVGGTGGELGGTGNQTSGGSPTGGVSTGGTGGVIVVPAEICSDYVDNDLDGDVDCNDVDCVGTEQCPLPPVDNCCDDNVPTCNNKALTDCIWEQTRDTTCYPEYSDFHWRTECLIAAVEKCGSSCPMPENNCTDGVDNDEDGRTDLDDASCVFYGY